MQSALAFLAVSSLGVMFGWQPMPDGSRQYEYVVQIEPELLATMKEGTTIPISSDVPDEIRPIARVRIMVGTGEVPRETLPTEVKPWPEGESRAGLLETQYIQPVADQSTAPRYQDQPILPPTSQPPRQDNGFGQTLQRSAEQARNTASQNDILPPTNEIRPAQSPTRYSQPIETANQQSGTQADISRLFGPAPASSLERAGGVQPIDQRSAPTSDRYATQPGNQPILPAARTAPSTADDWRANESSTASNRYERLDEPVTAAPPRDPRQGQQTAAATTPGVFNAPWPPIERFTDAPLAQEWNSRTAQDSRSGVQPASTSSSPSAWPETRTNSSAFDVAERTSPSGTRPAGDSLSFPAVENGGNSPSSTSHVGSPPSVPEIRRDMLKQPADAALVTASGDPVRPTPASPPIATGFPAPAQPQPTTPTTLTMQPVTPSAPSATNNGTTNNSKTFPLLLAWVLLSGSGAGNLYLFWSYLDIRHKYRGLVRTARRKLGKRIAEDIDEDDYED